MEKKLPQRKRMRYKGYDYSKAGYYFVTLVVKDRRFRFGNIDKGIMQLNEFGKVVDHCWRDLVNHYLNCELDEFIVMPDHVHGIVIISYQKLNEKVPSKRLHGLSEMMRGFKTFSSKRINLLLDGSQKFSWQKSFHDRIIRDEKALNNIRNYIMENSQNWKNKS